MECVSTNVQHRQACLQTDTHLTGRVHRQTHVGTDSAHALQVGVALTKLLLDTATIDVPLRDANGKLTGKEIEEPAFVHGLVNGYDDKGKGWWKKFGMVTMHNELQQRLTDKEVWCCN